MKEIILAKNAGFCFGVKRAVDETLKTQREFNKKIYTLGPLIHNNDVVKFLEKNNIYSVDLNQIDSLKQGDVIVIRSHGVKENVIDILNEKGLKVINATCPYVTNIQQKAKKYYNEGYKIVIVGDENHPEVIGINGWCNDSALIINKENYHINFPKKVCVLSQTTEKKETWDKVLTKIVTESKEIVAFNTICSATEVRQNSALELSKEADTIIVVGGKNSSNTTKLYEICKNNCPNTFHIENVNELTDDMLKDKDKLIGVAAGASTPDWVIEEVTSTLKK